MTICRQISACRRVVSATVLVACLALTAAAEDRAIDGSGNYLQIPTRGAANTPMIRFGYSSEFKDSTGAMIDDSMARTPATSAMRSSPNL